LDLAPNDPLTHYNLALTLEHKGDAQLAAQEFATALQLKPDWADAHYGLGAARYDLRDIPGALQELRTATELDPKNVGARRLLARIYVQQNDSASAEAELRKALAVKPSADLHFEMGMVQGQMGKLDSAAAEFKQVLAVKPRFAPAHAMLGVTLRRQGHHEAALAQFRQAIALDPRDPEAQYNLGMELKAGGDSAGAVTAFQRAIELKPDFEQAHYNLGIALRAQGKSAAAKKELEDLKGLHDFRARLDWCVKDYAHANHPPIVKVLGGMERRVRSGDAVMLDGGESRDPDGQALKFKWIFYPEAGTYRDKLPELMGADEAKASFIAPKVDEPQTLHVVLIATDAGEPPLTRYRRVVVQVLPRN